MLGAQQLPTEYCWPCVICHVVLSYRYADLHLGKCLPHLRIFVCRQLIQHIQTVAASPFINYSSLLKWVRFVLSEVGSHQRLLLMVWRHSEVLYKYFQVIRYYYVQP